MTTKGFFILGTDTHVGKTAVAVSFLSALKSSGYSTVALKPIASGAQATKNGLRNEDAISLQEAATIHLPYEQVNPFCFAAATAPHIAAAQQACELSVTKTVQACRPLLHDTVDYCVIEGIGGVLVPLNERETMLDLVQALDFPIILVVGLRLGCLNHTLLTYESLKIRNISIAACLCNQIDPDMSFYEENRLILNQYIQVPFFTFIPYVKEKIGKLKLNIDWSALIENVAHFA
jgi:dethiobiotin synthetase